MSKLLLLLLLTAPFVRLPRDQKQPSGPPLPASIALTVKSAAGATRAGISGSQKQPRTRLRARVKAGEKPEIRWMVKNLDPRKPIKDVVVHFLVTRQRAPNEPVPAAPRQGSVMDQVMGMTLAPRGATTGNYHTALHEPGDYLVEVELLDPNGSRRQFCAVDLRVE